MVLTLSERPTERRFQMPTLISGLLSSRTLGTTTEKPKKTSELTPDNANRVLTSSLDFSKFHLAVSEKAEMTEGEMFALL